MQLRIFLRPLFLANVLKCTLDADNRIFHTAYRFTDRTHPDPAPRCSDYLQLFIIRHPIFDTVFKKRLDFLTPFRFIECYCFLERWRCIARYFMNSAHFVRPDYIARANIEFPPAYVGNATGNLKQQRILFGFFLALDTVSDVLHCPEKNGLAIIAVDQISTRMDMP